VTDKDSCAEITENLDIDIPCAVYSTSFGTLAFEVQLEYAGQDHSGHHLWRLADFKECKTAQKTQCADINDNLTISIPCAEYTSVFGSITLGLIFKYAGPDTENHLIWILDEML